MNIDENEIKQLIYADKADIEEGTIELNCIDDHTDSVKLEGMNIYEATESDGTQIFHGRFNCKALSRKTVTPRYTSFGGTFKVNYDDEANTLNKDSFSCNIHPNK